MYEEDEVEIYETREFEKVMNKLNDKEKNLVEDEIDRILKDPEIGIQKRGDLAHLWVHKFKINTQELLLGYSWVKEKLTIYLLSLGSHENFYKKSKERRKANLKIIK